MVNSNLFGWLVDYHCSHNLKACLPHIRDGITYSPITYEPIREGLENELYTGVLIVANGETLLEELVKGNIIMDTEDIHPDFVAVNDSRDLSEYLNSQENRDGSHIFDSANHKIARVYEFNNNPPALQENGGYSLLDRIPHDFCSYNRKIQETSDKIGTKTRLAIKLPQAQPHLETFQIKRTGYTPLGMGKVTHFNKDGLAEEFFLMYDGKEGEIAGVHRTYSTADGELKRAGEKTIPVGNSSYSGRNLGQFLLAATHP